MHAYVCQSELPGVLRLVVTSAWLKGIADISRLPYQAFHVPAVPSRGLWTPMALVQGRACCCASLIVARKVVRTASYLNPLVHTERSRSRRRPHHITSGHTLGQAVADPDEGGGTSEQLPLQGYVSKTSFRSRS